MKIRFEEHKRRLSLLLLFSGVVLLLLLVTSAIVGAIVFFLIYSGALVVGHAEVNSRKLFLILGLISVAIGAILAFVTLHFPLKPINKILNAMNRLASGDYSVRLSFRGIMAKHPTVVELTNSFNQMASELEHTEMLRSDFINNFSHEFKTPIVSIAGFAKLLKRGNLSEEKKAECLNIIEEESLRLSQMATNVLNLTKVENQTILTDVAAFNLTEQIRTCVLMLESKWTKKHIGFSLPEEEFYAYGNEELLRHVWINLIDNAIKFSHEYGTVEIMIGPTPRMIHVTITDFGEDIPKEAQGRIFNKFFQADESHATKGNGVGLAVVKKIVDLHGGKIDVESGEGRTSFTVSLPLQR